MAVGAIEPQFYAELLSKIGSDFDEFPQLIGPDSDDLKIKLANVFKTKTRDEWSEIFDGSDACVTPVLELNEAPEHPHNKARESFVKNHAGDMMAPVINLKILSMISLDKKGNCKLSVKLTHAE